jgi:hypothetical protein
MRVFECPQRDVELRTNGDEDLPASMDKCPTHYIPLAERTHAVGQCRDYYTKVDGNVAWHCVHEPGAQAYDEKAVA